MKKTLAVLVLAFFLTSALSTMFKIDSVIANAENGVWFEISHGYWYNTVEDIVTNVPHPRVHQWFFQIHNLEDETGQPMINPNITLFTDLEFVDFGPWTPSISDGEYKWEFALELPECSLLPASAYEPNYTDYSCPGFSAERSVSPEVLVEPATIQSLSLTFILQDALPTDVNSIQIGLGVPNIIFQGERLVDYTILSLNNVEDWATDPGGWHANPSDLSIGKIYQFEATLEAVKSPDLGGTPKAKPGILIHYAHWDDLESIRTGSSATATHPEGPTVTVSAEGEYEWYASVSYSRQDFWFEQVVSEVVENPDPPPPYTVKIPATIGIDPDVLNSKSKGEWVTSYIELLEGYNASAIDVEAVELSHNGFALSAEWGDIQDDMLMVKFDRQTLIEYLKAKGITDVEVTLTITGKLLDGTLFEGSDTIRVIDE
ncbi:MAG: hypothetical protein ACE5IF_04925 [Candidatus Bathyarchaeia archaeon]